MHRGNEKKVYSEIRNKYGLLVFFAAMVIFFAVTRTGYMSVNNVGRILIGQAYIGILALGAILIVIIGDFDISIGYMLGFVMMLGGFLSEKGFGLGVVLLAMILAGVLAGLVNGLLIVKVGIKSPIATLGFGIVLYAFTRGMSNGNVLSKNIPQEIISFAQMRIGGILMPVYVLAILFILMIYVLGYTPFGKKLYAIGGCERATYLSGVNTRLVRISVYVISGLMTAIAAILMLGQSQGANPGRGPEYLNSTYAVVYLSVTMIQPGVYNAPGVLFSLLLLGFGFNGLSLMGTPSWFENVFYGLILIISMLFSNKEARKAIS